MAQPVTTQMSPYTIQDPLVLQRQEADRAAMIRALMGDKVSENQPYGSFAEHWSESAIPAQRQERKFIAGPNNIVDPLVSLGFEHRPQGSYPPASYPQRYDFPSINPPVK